MAKVVSVNISKSKGTIKIPIKKGFFKKGWGLVGDAHAGDGPRMVSMLAEESIEKMRSNGLVELTAGSFAENITTCGIQLFSLPVGTKLKIGETIQEVTQIGKECHIGCNIKQKVGKCIMPLEGIFTRVIKEGTVKVGDTIEIMDQSLSILDSD